MKKYWCANTNSPNWANEVLLLTVWLAITKNLSLHAVSSVLELHCVVPENVRTPHGRFFLRPPPPTPLAEYPFQGVFWCSPPPWNLQFFKRLVLFPYTMSHRCNCQVKPTTYLTSIESHFIVYNVRAIPVGFVEWHKWLKARGLVELRWMLSFTRKSKKIVKPM